MSTTASRFKNMTAPTLQRVGDGFSEPFTTTSPGVESPKIVSKSGLLTAGASGTLSFTDLYPAKPLPFKTGHTRKKQSKSAKEKLSRRLQGFVLEINGTEARVVLDEKGAKFEYELPAKVLTDAGVKHVRQPFQLDEWQSTDESGYKVRYQCVPLAYKAQIRRLSMSDELEEKLRRLKNF